MDVTAMPFVRTMRVRTMSFVLAKRDIPIRVQRLMSSARVGAFHCSSSPPLLSFWSIESCLVNNGGCDSNADCSHDAATNAVKCTCKTGYVLHHAGSSAVCTGKRS